MSPNEEGEFTRTMRIIKKKDINSIKKRFTCKRCRVTGNQNEIHALESIIQGRRNTIKGHDNEVWGDKNHIFGVRASVYGDYNKVYGFRANIAGNQNTVRGNYATVNGDENVVYGNYATVNGVGNVIRGQNCIVNGVLMSENIVPQSEEEASDRSALENETTCAICLENVATCAIFPCRHQCTCVKCSRYLGQEQERFKCPICRGNIVSIIHFYK